MSWKTVEHDFTFPKLDYSSHGNFLPCIKVRVYFKKLDSIDYDTFFGHWRTVHPDLVLSTPAFKKQIIRYVQHHQTPEMKELAKSLGEGFLDYDACVGLYVRTWDDWLEFTGSVEYKTTLAADCHRFMALPMTYMVGRENLVFGDGAKDLGGNDGFKSV